jgi:hypothetical protein
MAEMMFYEKLSTLDSKAHAGLRLKTDAGFQFAAKTNSVPIVGIEFVDTARDYPIVFVKGTDNEFLPVALLGLRENENLLVGQDGHWEGRYIPAFIRRYPFVPAEVKAGELVVCLDEAASALNKEEGEWLFESDKPTAFLQAQIQLLQDYQTQAVRTAEFSKHLKENNLLVESNAEAKTADGASFRLNGLYVVDEKRLQVLDKDKVHGLFISGELGLVYAHLLSLGNL